MPRRGFCRDSLLLGIRDKTLYVRLHEVASDRDSIMRPLVQMYGGVHDDPGSRQRFLAELAKRDAPHFVAVEWERSVFERLVLWRPWIERELCQRSRFLDSAGCRELSLALAWEGDAHIERFPSVDCLWLEEGYQEADLQRRSGGKDDDFLKGLAGTLLERLINPSSITMGEFLATATSPPEPQSKGELIDRVSKKAWAEASGSESQDFARDERWAMAIAERSARLHSGWIAVVVGWAHANPKGDDRRLRGLLSSRGFNVNPVCLAPGGPRAPLRNDGTDAH